MPRRRGNNEGSYYKLPSGKWRAAVTVGKKKRITHTCAELKEAKAWIAATLENIRLQQPVTSGTEQLDQYLVRWIEDHKAPKLRASSLHVYRFVGERVCKDAIGRIALGDLRRTHIEAFYGRLQNGLSGTSINTIHAVLTQALNDAVDDEFIDRNPAVSATAPRRDTQERQVLDSTEIERFINDHRQDRLGVMWALLATSGLRISEALSLRWTDIEGDYLLVERGKTKRSRRQVPVLPIAAELLAAHRNRQREERLAAGPGWEGAQAAEGLVFRRLNGRSMTQPEVWRVLQRALEESGLPAMRIHDLRHSAATFMMQSGVPIEVVSRIIGHSSISTTNDIYGHIRPAMLEDARERMARYLERR